MEPIIRAEGLVKTFSVREKSKGIFGSLRRYAPGQTRSVRALDGVGFSIGRGELVGYIGPNGAGKSTTVKILSGIMRPDGGTCVIDGRVPWLSRAAHVRNLGVVFGQKSQLLWDLPPEDSFELMRDMYRVPRAQYLKTRAELVERMDAGSFLKTPVRQLSLGQRMRCEVIASLLHNPRLLFLDEPTIGLDAISKRALRAFIKERNEKDGLTVILTTHDMDDVEALCSRVMVLGHGRLLADGAPDTLRAGFAKRRLTAAITRPLTDPLPEGAACIQLESDHVAIDFDPSLVAGDALVSFLSAKCGLTDVTIERPRIEDVIASVYERLNA